MRCLTINNQVQHVQYRFLKEKIIASYLFQIANSDALAVPVFDSTTFSRDSIDNDAEDNGTDDIEFSDMEFDVADSIDNVRPIREDSFHDCITETILEDNSVGYTIIESGSKRQTRDLVSYLGYAYTVKVMQTFKECIVNWSLHYKIKYFLHFLFKTLLTLAKPIQ